MRKMLHALEAHCSCHTLKRVRGTEYLVYGIRVFRFFFENHDTVAQALDMLACFIDENIEILTYIHFLIPLALLL